MYSPNLENLQKSLNNIAFLVADKVQRGEFQCVAEVAHYTKEEVGYEKAAFAAIGGTMYTSKGIVPNFNEKEVRCELFSAIVD